MTFVLAAFMIAALAALVAYPLWGMAESAPVADSHDSREQLKHEKDVALIAIREAELDRAMGKLSDEDYGTLRGQYEQRAISAIAALDDIDRAGRDVRRADGARGDGAPGARFCPSCGRRFQNDDRFCPTCGRARGVLA